MNTPQKQGFTLIELLVVIAIIAILAAILFPVFAKVREKARQTACLSNMKQMNLALLQYAEDYSETYPAVGDSPSSGFTGWVVEVMPYIKSTKIFTCPSNPNTNNYFNTNYANDYGANSTYNQSPGTFPNGGVFSAQNGPGVELAEVTAPSQVIALAEMANNSFYYQVEIELPAQGGAQYSQLFAGHTGFGNYAFADGHVKALKPYATVGPNDGGSGQVNMWTIDNVDFNNANAIAENAARSSGAETGYLPTVASNLTIATKTYQ